MWVNPRYLKTITQFILLPVLIIYLFFYLLSYAENSGRVYNPNIELIPAVNTNYVKIEDSPADTNDKPIRIGKRYPDFNIEDFNFHETSKPIYKTNRDNSAMKSTAPSVSVFTDNLDLPEVFNQSNEHPIDIILDTKRDSISTEKYETKPLEPDVNADSLLTKGLTVLAQPNDMPNFITSAEILPIPDAPNGKLKFKEEIVEPNEDKLNKPEPPAKKTILLWNNLFRAEHSVFGTNGSAFVGEKRCPVDNCVVTHDRDLMPLNEYDVVVFHIWNLRSIALPAKRSNKQYYAFVSLESPTRFRISKVPKDFFNWTITYRLDSDFPWPYFKVMDDKGSVIAPFTTSNWHNPEDDTADIEDELLNGLNKKRKKVAWFVNRCHTKNHRELYVKELQRYIDVDVYGICGPLTCPNATEDECLDILKNDYYFYLAFENSHCPDYVTEKVLNALQHDTVPIVFGGANYSNFLPPMSFIDADDYAPKELAQLIDEILVDKDQYAQFFWWKKFYSFHSVGRAGDFSYLHPFCDICKALNDPKLQPKQYDNIKMWWNGHSTDSEC